MPKSSVRTLIFEGWVNFQALTTRTQSSLNLTALFKALVMERQQSSCDDDMHARSQMRKEIKETEMPCPMPESSCRAARGRTDDAEVHATTREGAREDG